MAKMKEKFPAEIYVVKEYDGDTCYLIADEETTGIAETNSDRPVAIYQLVRVATLRNKTEVV